MASRVSRYLPPILWFAVIVALTSAPVTGVPQIRHLDKLAHFAIYLPLGFLLARAVGGAGWKGVLAALAVCLAAAACDEIHQLAVPGRSADIFDFAADVAGCLTGTALHLAWRRWRKRPLSG